MVLVPKTFNCLQHFDDLDRPISFHFLPRKNSNDSTSMGATNQTQSNAHVVRKVMLKENTLYRSLILTEFQQQICVHSIVIIDYLFQTHHANLREDPDGQDHHPRGGALWLYRERQGQDPGQGGNPPRSAEAHLRWKAARGWKVRCTLMNKAYICLLIGPALFELLNYE